MKIINIIATILITLFFNGCLSVWNDNPSCQIENLPKAGVCRSMDYVDENSERLDELSYKNNNVQIEGECE